MGIVRLAAVTALLVVVACTDDIPKPQCQVDTDCTGSAGACEAFACVSDKCETVPAVAGTAAPTQVAGDCLLEQCDGSGHIVTVADDSDLPITNSPCVIGTCTNGAPGSTPADAGAACGSGLVCDGKGNCLGCIAGSECPGSDTTCQTRLCNAGTCGFTFAGSGTRLPNQVIGDCEAVVCNGSGGTATIPDNTNVPTSMNQCLQAVCTNGTPSNPPQPEGTACGSGGSTICDGSGDCVGCVLATDCPGSDTACATRTCTAGTCGFEFAGSGTVLADQTPGNCEQAQCDGSGNVVNVVDDTNTPANTACTTGTCTAGSAGFTDDSAGTSCGSGASVCDGSGNCVGCITGSDCPGPTTDCQQPVCASGVCGTDFIGSGTPTTNQTPGDCQENVCDGSGNIISVEDDTNTPTSTDCATGTCTSGSAGFTNLPQDTVCQSTDECDGSGNCVVCGDNGALEGAEVCNGTNLDGATCQSVGAPPTGTLACAADCFSFDTTGCTGGWISAAGSGTNEFAGTPCIDGLRFFGTNEIVAACTTDQGIWRGDISVAVDQPVWVNADGTGAGVDVTSQTGRGLAVFDTSNVKIAFFTTNNGSGVDLFWTSNSGFTATPVTWQTGSANQASFPEMIFAAIIGSSDNTYISGWDPASGQAFVFHGNTINSPCATDGVAGCEWEVFLGSGVTGTATGITSGNVTLSQTTFDIHVAVTGTTGTGEPATGAGIYWSCDNGNSYVEDDNGIAASDKPLLWKVYADPSTYVTQPSPRTCPTNQASIAIYAGTMYATLLGGGQVYKTVDGGATWALANTGLPAGAQVLSLAIDCSTGNAGTPDCANPQLLYAATSVGVYKSTNGGASWAVDGLAGSVVNAVTIEAQHPSEGMAASPTGAVETGNVATITMAGTPGFAIDVGDTVILAFVGVAGYDGTFTVTSVISPTQFTVTLPTTGLAASGGGSVVKFNPRVLAGTNQSGGLFETNAP